MIMLPSMYLYLSNTLPCSKDIMKIYIKLKKKTHTKISSNFHTFHISSSALPEVERVLGTGPTESSRPPLCWNSPLVVAIEMYAFISCRWTMISIFSIQVVPGRAGGGSFRRKKKYIAKKEFAYRMCARRPTGAMPKPFLCCERAFCCSMVVMCRGGDLTSFDVMRSVAGWDEAIKVLLQYYSVLQSTTPVLLCTAKCYSSTTLYYKVLLQYYSLLHSTTTYYSSTTLYYKVLLCTAKYYSSTTLYYKVLLQYYSVLQSTTPVLLCTTKYYSSTTLYYTVLQRATPVLHCTTKQHSWLMSVAYETSFTMRGATGVILQRHEILHLPRKMTVMIDPRHIWNVTYNERSNRNHNPSSPNTAPATQNESHDWSASHMKRHLQCAEQAKSTSNLSKYCACHAKWISWLIRVTYETSFTMRGASTVSHQPHQILRLPRNL